MLKEWKDLEHDLGLIEIKKYEDFMQEYQARTCLRKPKLCLHCCSNMENPERQARPVPAGTWLCEMLKTLYVVLFKDLARSMPS